MADRESPVGEQRFGFRASQTGSERGAQRPFIDFDLAQGGQIETDDGVVVSLERGHATDHAAATAERNHGHAGGSAGVEDRGDPLG